MTSIVIADKAPRVHYKATSGQTTFSVPFPWFATTDLKVYVNEVLMTLVGGPASANNQYSVSGTGTSNGGTITFGSPGRVGGDEVVIFRDIPIARTTDLPTTGPLPASTINADLDRQTAMVQQTEVNVQQRTLRMDVDDFVKTLNPIPNRINRAGRFLAFDNAGQPVMVAPGGSIDTGGGSIAFLGRIWTDDQPPPPPWIDGTLWWESSSGTLFVYYDDGNSQQWVQVNIGTGSYGQAPAGPPPQASFVTTTLLTAASGNFKFDTAARYYRIRAVAGGGGGGGCRSSLAVGVTPALYGASGGGGSGAYGETGWYAVGGSVTGAGYTVGAGGQGSTGSGNNTAGNDAGSNGGNTTWNDGIRGWSFAGGDLAPSMGGAADVFFRPGGYCGEASGTGLLFHAGGHGGPGLSSPTSVCSGTGGANPFGEGGHSVSSYPGATVGSFHGLAPESGYGGGGGGCVRLASAPAAGNKGGDGRPGVILVDQMF